MDTQTEAVKHVDVGCMVTREEMDTQAELGIERLLRDAKAGWVMGPSNEVLRILIGKSVLDGFEALDFW